MRWKVCRTDCAGAGWLNVDEKMGEETRGRSSRSPDEATDGNYDATEREIRSKSMPDGPANRRIDSKIAGWTREPSE